MKSLSLRIFTGWLTLAAAVRLSAADATPAPATGDVIARGKGLTITRSDLDDAVILYKANLAARGGGAPTDEASTRIEAQMLDRLIATRLILARATEADRVKGKQFAIDFIAGLKTNAPSEESFKRQILAVGMSMEQFNAQISEQSIVREVIDREVKPKQEVAVDQAKKFYDDHAEQFQQPEALQVLHLLLSTQNPATGQDLSEERRKEKRELMEKLLARANQGEDFTALVKDYSEDQALRQNGGVYWITRAKDDPRTAMIPELEGAAFSLTNGQTSGIIATKFGFHVVKLLDRKPAQKTAFADVQKQLQEDLTKQAVQRAVPTYIAGLRKEASVEILVPELAQPPEPAAAEPKK